MSKAIELVPQQLWWSPEGPSARTPATCGAKVIGVEELCDCEYSIPHYAPQAAGHAFGPLGLDQVLQFCAELHRGLERNSKIVLTYPADNSETHTNAAVLVGAYLVLWLRWNVSKVVIAVGTSHANRMFPCSWAKSQLPEPKRILRVRDCWEGLEQAVRHGWLDPVELKDPDALTKKIADHQKMALQFDGSWIAPGFVFVCADPVSTALDPNPITFTRLFPNEDSERHSETMSTTLDPEDHLPLTPDMASTTDSRGFSALSDGSESTPDPFQLPGNLAMTGKTFSDDDSVDTVCKAYGEYHKESACGKAQDFTTLLKHLGVTLMVRTNFASEPGLEQSYKAKEFADLGIDHLEMPFADVQGAVPGAAELEVLLGRCRPYLDGSQGAIALHCKGGFGRSICCASKLVSLRYNIPGRALLGWIRIARPGAVNTPNQESFICSLNGTKSSSLTREIDEDCVRPMPKCGCSVQ